MTTEVTPDQQAEASLLLEEHIDERIFRALESNPYRTQQLLVNMLQGCAYDYRLREILRNAIGPHEHTYSAPFTSTTSGMNWR